MEQRQLEVDSEGALAKAPVARGLSSWWRQVALWARPGARMSMSGLAVLLDAGTRAGGAKWAADRLRRRAEAGDGAAGVRCEVAGRPALMRGGS
jgi:hypothetical protein